jgi:hypothetical protein
MVFPRNTAEWPDFDVYYWGHKHWLLAGVIFCDSATYLFQIALNEHPLVGLIDKVFAVLLFAGLFGVLLAKGKRLNVALLVYLVLLYPIASVFYQLHIGGGPESGS